MRSSVTPSKGPSTTSTDQKHSNKNCTVKANCKQDISMAETPLKYMSDSSVVRKVQESALIWKLTKRGVSLDMRLGGSTTKILTNVQIQLYPCNAPQRNCTKELGNQYHFSAKYISLELQVLNNDGRTTTLLPTSHPLHIKPGYGKKTVLRVEGEGHQNVHGRNSDLLFKIEELPHPSYTRKDNNLIYTHWLGLA